MIAPPDQTSVLASGIAASLMLGSLAVLFVVSLVSALRAARAARVLEHPDVAPSVGSEGVVVGVVEPAAGDTDPCAPVQLHVRQQIVGTTRRGGQRVAKWSGPIGPVLARPFRLRLASGESISVQPGADARLIDAFDDHEVVSKTERVRKAALEVGEEARVFGTLKEIDVAGAGYRGRGRELALVSPRAGPMLLSTQNELSRGFRKSRSVYGWVALGLALLLAFDAWMICSDFVLLTMRGRTVEAPVQEVRVERYKRKNKPGVYTHYYLVSRDPKTGRELSLEMEADKVLEIMDPTTDQELTKFPVKPGTTAVFVVDDEAPARHLLGDKPYIAAMDMVVGFLFVGFGVALFGFGRWRARTPFESRELTEDGLLD